MDYNLGLVSIGIFVALSGLLILGVPLAFTSGAIAIALCLIFFGPDSLFIVASRAVSFLDFVRPRRSPVLHLHGFDP